MVELQRAAYAVEADLIDFDRIPPMLETVDDVLAVDVRWIGAFVGDDLTAGLGFVDGVGHRLIDRLFVDPDHARTGMGRALVTAALKPPLVAVSTGTANYPAVALYEELGFERQDERGIAQGVTITGFHLRVGG